MRTNVNGNLPQGAMRQRCGQDRDWRPQVNQPQLTQAGYYRQSTMQGGVPSAPQVRYVLNVPRVIGAALVPIVATVALSPIPRAIAGAISVPAVESSAVDSEVIVASSGALVWSKTASSPDSATVTPGKSTYQTHPEQWDWLCYDQGAEPWGSQLYQTGSIEATGCGLCSASHALTMVLGEEIPPDVLARQMQDYSDAHGYIDYGSAGTIWAGWEEIMQGLYGDRVNIGKIPSTPDAVKEAVTHGKAVVYNAPIGGDILLADGTWRTTWGGHVLTCYRYKDGKFYVKDSSSQTVGHGLGNAIAYSAEDFAMVMEQASGHLGYVYTFEAKATPTMD